MTTAGLDFHLHPGSNIHITFHGTASIHNESDNLEAAHERMREARVQCLVVKNSSNFIVGVIQIFK